MTDEQKDAAQKQEEPEAKHPHEISDDDLDNISGGGGAKKYVERGGGKNK